MKKRLSGKEALQHPWFKKCAQQRDNNLSGELDVQVISRLKNFKGQTQFKRAAMNLLIKMTTDEEVEDLRNLFEKLDEDGSGMILSTELSKILQQKKMKMSDQEISDLIKEVDYHGNGKINYSEFLAAAVDVNKIISESKLRAIFQQFDTDNSGKITADNIFYAMQKLNQNVRREEIEKMIEKHDKVGDKVLSYEEFVQVFSDFD